MGAGRRPRRRVPSRVCSRPEPGIACTGATGVGPSGHQSRRRSARCFLLPPTLAKRSAAIGRCLHPDPDCHRDDRVGPGARRSGTHRRSRRGFGTIRFRCGEGVPRSGSGRHRERPTCRTSIARQRGHARAWRTPDRAGRGLPAVDLPNVPGRTLFLGNPPYVRHHAISAEWKAWFATAALARGLKASKLAGLHIHFFLKTLLLAERGDYGAFVTSAEWLDVNYGALVRQLLLGELGGQALHVVAPAAMPFSDTATTAAITCFEVGREPTGIEFRPVGELEQLNPLGTGRAVPRQRLEKARRWSPFLKPAKPAPAGHIELGELCRVHRGQVTGCNAVWIAANGSSAVPDCVLTPTVTKARELFDAMPRLSSRDKLRRVIDLPVELDELNEDDRIRVREFLTWARSRGAHASYIARHRRAWWSVGLRDPAPILTTYMARRPPAFVRNVAGRTASQHRPRPLSARALTGYRTRRALCLASTGGSDIRRTHVRGRPDQVRTEGAGARPNPTFGRPTCQSPGAGRWRN